MSGWNLTGLADGAVRGGSADDALSVSQAVELAAGALEAIPQLVVLGEVTGFRGPNARSGHCYFQIKDDSSAVDCIIWRGSYAKRAFDLRDGMQVHLTGSFNLYKATGRMSFVARSFSLAGEGMLRQQVAALAEKLRREGLMDESRKRRIPVFCTRVAVVTSLSGAVIDDVKRTLRRRNPLVEIVCIGSKVQGEGAPAELIEGLERAAALDQTPDCILLVRGGGSFEDLMTFNDEGLARAVAACPVPVVTGIGHEPDNSICDMVSDRRCSTPTAAAESVAPALGDLVDVLDARERRMVTALSGSLRSHATALDGVQERASRAWGTSIERFERSLAAAAARPCLSDPSWMIERRMSDLEQTAERLAASTSGFASKRHRLEIASERVREQGRALVSARRAGLAAHAASLDALSPLKVLSRGYSIAYGEGGVETSAARFAAGDDLRVRFVDGVVSAKVTGVAIEDSRGSRPSDR